MTAMRKKSLGEQTVVRNLFFENFLEFSEALGAFSLISMFLFLGLAFIFRYIEMNVYESKHSTNMFFRLTAFFCIVVMFSVLLKIVALFFIWFS